MIVLREKATLHFLNHLIHTAGNLASFLRDRHPQIVMHPRSAKRLDQECKAIRRVYEIA